MPDLSGLVGTSADSKRNHLPWTWTILDLPIANQADEKELLAL